MATLEEDAVCTLKEHLDEENKSIEETIAIVGAGDETSCSYVHGYMDRQAVYKCNTCDPLNENLAGICLACSMNCHADHDVMELYTKRNFRCDCGNSKFPDLECSLRKEKDTVNSKNQYNQNFKGTYCTCKRPYPDPDGKEEDEMIQCVLCEDWFHTGHLGTTISKDFAELVCDQCVKEHSFLQFYKEFAVFDEVKTTEESSLKRKYDQIDEKVSVDDTVSSNSKSKDCFLIKLKSVNNEIPVEELKAMFFVENWRKKLCLCNDCKDMYKNKEIEFLLKESDTLAHHEAKGMEKVEGQWKDTVDSIGELDHIRKIEVIRGFQELKQGLTDFLSKFADGDVVKKEDVDGFMEEMNKRKRQRFEEGFGIPPDMCK